MIGYRAHAFTPGTGAKTNSGTIRTELGWLYFESDAVRGKMPLQNAVIRRGGHNDEQIFFEHPSLPGWSIYSGDPELLNDPILRSDPHFARIAGAVARRKRAIPFPVMAFGAVALVLLLGLLVLWTQKDRIVNFVAERIPVSWEVSIGDQAFENVRRSGHLLTNSVWEAQVAEIRARLVRAVGSSEYEFRFHIMQDTNVNAFALPGGNMVILTGLLEEAESAEEVAGVLAHEIAHVTHRHSLRNMIKSAGFVILLQSLLGDVSGLAGIAVEGSRYLVQQKFSRDFEREADDTGWEYLLEAKIDPRGMTRFFEKMKKLAAASGNEAFEGSLSLLSTHPTSQERIDRLNAKWKAASGDKFEPLGQWGKQMRSGEATK